MAIKIFLSFFVMSTANAIVFDTTAPASCETILSILNIPFDPMSYKDNQILVPSGFVIGPIQANVDYSDLIGTNVVGIIERGRKKEIVVNGAVRAVETSIDTNGALQLDVAVQSGSSEIVVHFKDNSDYDYYLKLYMVRDSSPEQIPGNFPPRLLRQLFKENMNLDMELQDFEVSHLMIQTYLNLPKNYSVTGTNDTLLGKSAKTTGHINFGKLKNNKRYTKKGLVETLMWLRFWMEWHNVVSVTDQQSDIAPRWIKDKSARNNAPSFLQWLGRLK